jgi:hypothetical protein
MGQSGEFVAIKTTFNVPLATWAAFAARCKLLGLEPVQVYEAYVGQTVHDMLNDLPKQAFEA